MIDRTGDSNLTSKSAIDNECSFEIASTTSTCRNSHPETVEKIHPDLVDDSSCTDLGAGSAAIPNQLDSPSSSVHPDASEVSQLPEIKLGLVQPRKGFWWPEIVPLIVLSGSLNGSICNMTVDGGSTTNFVSEQFVLKHDLQVVKNFNQPFKVVLPDNSCMSATSGVYNALVECISGDTTYVGNHQFMVLKGLATDVILGRPFLCQSKSMVCHENDTLRWPSSGPPADSKFTTVDANPNAENEPLVDQSYLSSASHTSSAADVSIDNPPHINDQMSPPNARSSTLIIDENVSSPKLVSSLNSISTSDQQHSLTDHSSYTNGVHEVGTTEQRALLYAKLHEYEQRLEGSKGKLPPSRGEFDHRIIEKDSSAKPPKQPAIRLKPAHARVMKETLDKLLEEGKIRRSVSPYAAPAFIVEQGDKQRMVVNYEKLNAMTETNATSLPHVDELIARLSKARVFSKIDLTSGFHQVRMHSDDIAKTAFSTPFGHFEWLVMPFGEKNAPASFVQLLSQHVLIDIVHDFIIVFIDDILIFSPDEDQHIEHVEAVLKRLADHELFVNPKKCTFMVNEVDFLGVRLRAGDDVVKLLIQENKTKAIIDWPVPKTIGQLRSFLGTANFSRTFIQNFSTIARPLTEATSGKFASKNASIRWEDDQQRAFDELKQALTQAPALAVPDEDKPFTLYTDASNFGIGAALCQWNEKLSAMQPCAYMSSKLTGSELNWTVHEKELYALVRALEHWTMYLSTTRHPINVFTDNVAMLYMLKSKKIPSKRSRWLSVLLRYRLSPQRIEGVNNVTADALSRRHDLDGGEDEIQKIRQQQAEDALKHLGFLNMSVTEAEILSTSLVSAIKAAYADDAHTQALMQDPARYHMSLHKGLLMDTHDRIIVPANPDVRAAIIRESHDIEVSGHLGINKTASRVRRHFDWNGLVRDVRQFVLSCNDCQSSKSSNSLPAGMAQPIPPPMNKGEAISIDFVGPFPRTARGKDFIMIMIDRFSRRVWYEPCRQTITGRQAADVLFERVVRHQGLPNTIVSDRDPRFKSHIWKGLWKRCGTKLAMTVAYKALANGLAENAGRTMQDMLRAFVNESRTDWDTKLPALEIAYNSSVNGTTGFAPFELDIGMMPRLPIDIATNQPSTNTSVDKFFKQWENNWALAHENIAKAQLKQKDHTDMKRSDAPYKVDDQVWLRIDKGSLQTDHMANIKLAPRVEGPYHITKLHGDCVVSLDLPKGSRRNKQFHVSQIKPFNERDEQKFPAPSSPISMDPSEDDEQLIDYELVDDQVQESNQSPASNDNVTNHRSIRQRKRVDHGFFVQH